MNKNGSNKFTKIRVLGLDLENYRIHFIGLDGNYHFYKPHLSVLKNKNVKTIFGNDIPVGTNHYLINHKNNIGKFRLLPSELADMEGGNRFNNFYAKKLGLPIIIEKPYEILQPRDYAVDDVIVFDEEEVERKPVLRRIIDFFSKLIYRW